MLKVFFTALFLSLLIKAGYIEEFGKIDPAIVPVRADKKLPEFTAVTLEGKDFTSSQISFPAILVFFQVSCPVCRGALHDLFDLEKEFKKKKRKLSIFAISGDSAGDVMVFYADEKIELKTLIDTGSVRQAFGASVTPLYYLVDRGGMVRGIVPGALQGRAQSLRRLAEYLTGGQKI